MVGSDGMLGDMGGCDEPDFQPAVHDPTIDNVALRVIGHLIRVNKKMKEFSFDQAVNYIGQIVLRGYMETRDLPEVIFGSFCARHDLRVGCTKTSEAILRHLGIYFTPVAEVATT